MLSWLKAVEKKTDSYVFFTNGFDEEELSKKGIQKQTW